MLVNQLLPMTFKYIRRNTRWQGYGKAGFPEEAFYTALIIKNLNGKI